jgi:hypothetical protein
VIACGALAGHVRDIVARRGWPVAVRPLPAVLHNRPQKIASDAERAVVSALRSGHAAALELWPDYFGHYRRLVWLAQEPSHALAAQAGRVAAMFGLPLTRIDTGVSRLERALEEIL